MKVVIIGGGAAGMLAGISSASSNNETIILEKMNSLGKKLRITGKGRCNITNNINIDEFIQNIPGNGRFMYSAFQNFTNEDIIKILHEEGLQTKVERGNRIFPVTDSAQSVIDALYSRLNKLKVKIVTGANVEDIIVKEEKACGVKYIKENKEYAINADKIILATGGASYKATGSTGDGYNIAKKHGHTVTNLKPGLIPFECYEKELCRRLQGLSLKNVSIKLIDKEKNKKIYEDFGEMMFTHFGVTGPTIISSSSHIVRYKNIEKLFANKKIVLDIDLKPALDNEKLDLRIRRDFEEFKNKKFKNSLDKLLPQKMIEPIIDLSKINAEKKVNEVTKEERKALIDVIKRFELHLSKFRPIDEAIITAGGISIKEIEPKTMESKIVKNLYFAGEIIDVDAYTGGFNLQIAFSTGYTAGLLK